MTSRKKIAIIIPSMGGGGAERVLLNLLALIKEKDFFIDLYVGNKKGRLIKYVPSWVKVHFIFPNDFIEKLALFLYRKYHISFLLKLYGEKIKGDYKTAISFLDSTYSEFLFFNKAVINKRVLIIHSSYKSYSNRFKFVESMYDRLQNRYEKVDSIITVSQESMQEFKELFGNKRDMRVIYNPLNIEGIISKSMEGNISLPKGVVNIVAIGSLIEVKGFERLIRACEKIGEDSFHLTILGEGPLKTKLTSLIKELGLIQKISLVGFMSNPYPWLLESDVFIMTSLAEGLPTVLCEAIILEKAVIVTNVPGCREVIDNGKYGFMVENNVDSIADGLKKLISDSNIRHYYQKQAKIRKAIFDDKRALRSYMEIFCENS